MPGCDDPKAAREQVEPGSLRRQALARVQEHERTAVATFHELKGRTRDRYRLGHMLFLMLGPSEAQPSLQRCIAVSKSRAVSLRLETRAKVRQTHWAVLVWLLCALSGCSAATPIEPHG